MLLLRMESENVGMCAHSKYSRLEALVHKHVSYDLSLQFLDSNNCCVNLLGHIAYRVY